MTEKRFWKIAQQNIKSGEQRWPKKKDFEKRSS